MSGLEQQPVALPQKMEPSFPRSERRKFSQKLFTEYKELFDAKFPLFKTEALGQTEYINEILLDDDQINLLYLPQDASRKDPEEQIKVSSGKDNTTIIIKNDEENPEVSFQTFEIKEDSIPVLIKYVKNSPSAIRKAKDRLKMLKDLEKFDLVYTSLDL